jgi:hypothetical protein
MKGGRSTGMVAMRNTAYKLLADIYMLSGRCRNFMKLGRNNTLLLTVMTRKGIPTIFDNITCIVLGTLHELCFLNLI